MDERNGFYGQTPPISTPFTTRIYTPPMSANGFQQPYAQQYGQQFRQPYEQSYQPPFERQYQSANAQVPAILEQTQILTPGGFQPLNKEERAEAARIALEASFSFDGYQVVRREFFSHKFDPTLTINGNSIIFNNACISKLDQVVYIQVLINTADEKLVIRPCVEGARDAIRWCVVNGEKRKSRQITCGLFSAKLHELMGWEALYRYKLQGSRITVQNEEIYIFDLTSTEVYLPAVAESDDPDAKPKRRAPKYPDNWRDSFGLMVNEHEASMRVSLTDSFGLARVTEKEPRKSKQTLNEIQDNDSGEVIKA